LSIANLLPSTALGFSFLANPVLIAPPTASIKRSSDLNINTVARPTLTSLREPNASQRPCGRDEQGQCTGFCSSGTCHYEGMFVGCTCYYNVVPTLTEWGLIAFGVLLAGSIAFMIRRRFTARPAGA
jgi:hypothetical protein